MINKKLIENIIFNITEATQKENKRGAFLGTLLYSPSVVHELHLLAKSYSEHEALDALYKDLYDDVDTLIEKDLGKNGYISKYTNNNTELWSTNSNTYLENLKKFISDNRNTIYDENKDSDTWSNLDDILDHIDEAIYKIVNLK